MSPEQDGETQENLTSEAWMRQYPNKSARHYRWFSVGVIAFGILIGGIWLTSIALQMKALSARKTNEVSIIDKAKESWNNSFNETQTKKASYSIQQELRMVVATLKATSATTTPSSTVTVPTTTVTTTHP